MKAAKEYAEAQVDLIRRVQEDDSEWSGPSRMEMAEAGFIAGARYERNRIFTIIRSYTAGESWVTAIEALLDKAESVTKP